MEETQKKYLRKATYKSDLKVFFYLVFYCKPNDITDFLKANYMQIRSRVIEKGTVPVVFGLFFNILA